MTGKLRLVTLTSCACIAVAACGGAARDTSPAARAPASTPDGETFAEPTNVEEAQDQIARLQAKLDGADKKTEKAAEQPAPTHDSNVSSEKPSPPPQGGAAPAREERPENVCGNRCRALASMKRAVDALCRMTGDTDTRCVDARRTLTQNTTHVSTCKCEGS
jgi:hypothetical protein